MTVKGFNADDAREWAAYVRALRQEIADRKAAGELSDTLAAPELMHHLLLQVLDAIDDVRPGRRHAALELPSGRPLLVFAWYQASVQEWADKRVADGVLTTTRNAGADRFWAFIEELTDIPRRVSAKAS